MPRLYNSFNTDLAYNGVFKCLQNKWRRRDVQTYIEEWTGYSHYELMENELKNKQLSFALKYEIMSELALTVVDMVEGIQHGIDPDFDPVSTRERRDGATGKMRDIAYLCIRHQMLGHIVKLGIEPLLNKRILPSQHASIPEHGQTGLARQVKRMLNRKLGIKAYAKTDCTAAYASVMYKVVIGLIKKEIPRACWIFPCMEVLARYAPGGHLIIGGYIDAWLFNFVMSYAIRYVLGLSKSRRGNKYPLVIRAATFMDDMLLLGRAATYLEQAIKQLKEWLWATFHMAMRTTTDTIKLYSVEEEKSHKREKKKAKRGCTSIDMGGYRISKTHITLRRRNVPRTIRCFQRAWTEYKRTGTIKRQRACQIISRHGMISNTDGFQFCHKYHVFELKRVAARVQAYWARAANRKRKEQIQNAVEKYRKQCAAFLCTC